MRDLPPQADALHLEPAAPAFLGLLQVAFIASLDLPESPEAVRCLDVPPQEPRPHAAPVGIVRLNT